MQNYSQNAEIKEKGTENCKQFCGGISEHKFNQKMQAQASDELILAKYLVARGCSLPLPV